MELVNRKNFIHMSTLALGSLVFGSVEANSFSTSKGKRVGIIGLDTSHSIAFTKSIFENPQKFESFKVVAAYPYGTKTIPSATDRIPKYTEEIQKYDVKIVESIKDLLQQVDFVLLETNDGRLHLEQAREVFKAGKPLFIDKPLAASYSDALEIFKLSEKYKVPFFSSSSLRYIDGLEDVINGKFGKVLGVDVYTPATLDASHPDFFWYGIHGVEMLFAAMGSGCLSVNRTHSESSDVLVGTWNDGRLGTVRGKRSGKSDFGGVVFCESGTVKLGEFKGYDPLLLEIIKFFETGKVPFDSTQTLEICAFIEGADESKMANGQNIKLKSINQI